MGDTKRTLSIGMQVAVIGVSGRFPGARNIHDFWSNLCQGTESITFFEKDKLSPWRMQPGLVNEPNFVAAKGIIEEHEYFDASFFGYSPREAEVMDPQIRLFHECAWEALEDAGYNPEDKHGTVGVFAGASPNVYWQGFSLLSRGDSSSEQFAALPFVDKDFMSANIAYKLNLSGPSVAVNSACSTSLVSVHLACRSLLTGECSMAIAGGVSVPIPGPQGYLYQEGMILSPDGHCRAFDADAAGTVPGEGVGVVVLKSLKRALADGDHIYAVIRGSAINNDGNRKIGFTAPSIDGQADVIRAAQRMSMVEPESISYIEAHGTGTTLGDPIEIEALKIAFQTQQRGYCQIGSVKSNIGHLDAASGVAGLIKTVLALQHRQIPPSLHFERANPRIDFAASPFVVSTQLTPWHNEHYPLRAGVSSFGIGGTNAHVILEEAPAVQVSRSPRDWHVLPLAAKSEMALVQMAQRLAQALQAESDISLADVAYTLQVGRAHFGHRRMVVAHSVEQAIAQLSQETMDSMSSGVVQQESRPLFWLFPGQGAQYVNMGQHLYARDAVFRAAIERCLDLAQTYGAGDLRALLYPIAVDAESEQRLQETQVAQPVLFSVEYALAQVLLQWGIKPQGMLGHSIGEYVAGCLAGVFSLEDAMRLVVRRGQLMSQAPTGAMLSVELSEAHVQSYLREGLSLAAVNTPQMCVVAGRVELIEVLEAEMQRDGHRCRRVPTSHAFHSALMEPVLEAFGEEVKRVALHAPQIPYLSNVSGTWIHAEEATDPAYWVRHLRTQVRFAEGISHLLEERTAILVEVGPGNSLSTFARQGQGANKEQLVLNLLRHRREEQPDDVYLLNRLGRLWIAGVNLNWTAAYAEEQRRRLSLPTYPFERQRFWYDESLEENVLAKRDLHLVPVPVTPQTTKHRYFYLPNWERQPRIFTSPQRQTGHVSTCLIFRDDYGIADGIAERFTSAGCKVIMVEKNTEYKEHVDDVFFINPGIDEQYQMLLEDLYRRYGAIDKIIHCWGMTNVVQDENIVHITNDLQEVGYHCLLSLARVVAKYQETPTHITIVSNNAFEVTGTEIVNPAQSLLIAPGRVISLEYKHIHCSNIDIVFTPNGVNATLINPLVDEIVSDSADEVVALRGKYRWTQTYKQFQLEEHQPPPLKAGGTYLLTGGLGAIGLTLAETLAMMVQANLVLIARSDFPARATWDDWLQTHAAQDQTSLKIHQLLHIEMLGSTVLIVTADVSNRVQMKNVVDVAIQRFQVVNGVIHCAGVADGALIQGRTREWDQHIFAAKI